MQLSTMAINDYIKQLGSEAPVPGGGSASALGGAIGVSLIQMVANLTIGKAKYANYEELNLFALEEGGKICTELLSLIDKDAEAYSRLSAAYKLPRATDEEKVIRNSANIDATLDAIKAPFEIMEASLKALNLCKSLVGKSNHNVSSDLGVSALNLLACINGAWLNVLINLSGLKNTTGVHIGPDIGADAGVHTGAALFYRTRGQEIADTGKKEADYIYETVKALLE
jgi:formiminotetrahydrofolate cyclodeaminase